MNLLLSTEYFGSGCYFPEILFLRREKEHLSGQNRTDPFSASQTLPPLPKQKTCWYRLELTRNSSLSPKHRAEQFMNDFQASGVLLYRLFVLKRADTCLQSKAYVKNKENTVLYTLSTSDIRVLSHLNAKK